MEEGGAEQPQSRLGEELRQTRSPLPLTHPFTGGSLFLSITLLSFSENLDSDVHVSFLRVLLRAVVRSGVGKKRTFLTKPLSHWRLPVMDHLLGSSRCVCLSPVHSSSIAMLPSPQSLLFPLKWLLSLGQSLLLCVLSRNPFMTIPSSPTPGCTPASHQHHLEMQSKSLMPGSCAKAAAPSEGRAQV